MSVDREKMNRRHLLKSAGAGAAAVAFSTLLTGSAWAEGTAPKKILFLTKSSGFEHSTVKRKSAEEPAYAEALLKEFAGKAGFEVTFTKDGTLFTADNLAKYDAIAFLTTGDLTQDSDKYKQVPKLGLDGKPMKDAKGKVITEKGELLYKEPGMGAAGKEAFLAAVKNGKGFIAFHCGSDTMHSHPKDPKKDNELIRDVNAEGKDEFDPYIQMLGGEFIVHGKQQPALLHTIDTKFPGAAAFDNAAFPEEWYSLKNFASDLHVIISQDCAKMEGAMYQRKPYPETWARIHGKGRVFYTSMGHREDVWAKPEFQTMVVGALKWITGQIEVDVTPNLSTVCPEADPHKFVEAKKK